MGNILESKIINEEFDNTNKDEVLVNKHPSKFISLHNKKLEIDINMIEIITKLNKDKLITRGCCENTDGTNSYIIFNYEDYIKLISNNEILNFIKNNCTISDIYYAHNMYRHIKYDENEYNEKFKKQTEVWICMRFPNNLIETFVNII